ncbi:btk-binding protein-related [Anaeramoeba flamelloides]|uniref:Btk-binding protein-related n=1 Tax=Anaeramoeba flamelloides TaxID=1746091 RepID=A0ABQ8Z949_9EUKA|nr:btk-binding protein-related [Anaeramoeba flamelloides]
MIRHPNSLKKVVTGGSDHILLWKGYNQLEFHSKVENSTKELKLEDETITDVVSGYCTYLILTKSGRVFCLGKNNTYKSIPLSDPKNCTFDTPRLVKFFQSKKNYNKIVDIAMGYSSCYFVCEDGKLYGSGSNMGGRLGILGEERYQTPQYITKNVSRVFSGAHGLAQFHITRDNELFVSGKNSNGQLGLNNTIRMKIPKRVTALDFEPRDIADITTGQNHSILLTNKGHIYSCGQANSNGHPEEKTIFTKIPTFKDKLVAKYAMGEYQQLVLTSDNELYGWGFRGNSPTKQHTLDVRGNLQPIKIDLPNLASVSVNTIALACGSNASFIYNVSGSSILQDFQDFFKSEKFTDLILGIGTNKIKCHQLLIKLRTNLIIKKIIDFFLDKEKKEIKNFLKWIYFDQINDDKLLKQTFDSLNLTYPPESSLKQDLLKLYSDEDSMDFSILIKNEDEDDEDDDEEEEEEESFEEIPVHKFILLARSGLFREMFDNINEKEESGSVKDYSGKSIESLEVLIKYFYTDKIELTADHDPVLIVEELEDAVEYYQLNENSNLLHQLDEIKKNNNLK